MSTGGPDSVLGKTLAEAFLKPGWHEDAYDAADAITFLVATRRREVRGRNLRGL